MSTTLAEKLAWNADTLRKTAAALASAIDVNDQAIKQEAGDVPIEKPAPPTGFTAKLGDDEASVVLEWVDPPENADAYQLEGLPALAANQSSYTVVGLAHGTTYTVPRLRRLGVNDNSEWVTATPPSVAIPDSDVVVDPDPGVYSGPPQGATTVAFDADLTKLPPGAYAVTSGVRIKDLMGLKVGVKLYCQKQYGVQYNKPGLAFNTIGNTLCGFWFRGIGQGEKTNDKAGGLIGDDSELLWSMFEDAIGVAAAFGFRGKSIQSGSNVRCLYNRFLNNGSAGFGGKGKKAEVAFNYFDGNNAKVGDTDGAGAGKFTRSEDMYFHDNTIKNGTGTMVWWDIENKRIRCSHNVLDGCKKLKDEFRQRGIAFEWSEDGPFEVSGNVIRNVAVPILVEETTGMTVQGNKLFRVGYSPDVACEIHLRDYYEGRSNWSPNKRLKNLTVVGNERGDDKGTEILIARSGSGTKFTPKMLKDDWGCVFQPEVRFAF